MKLLNHPLFFLIFTLVCAVFSFSLYQTAKKSTTGQERLAAQQEENQKVLEETAELQAQLEYATSPLAQEKMLRDELLLQKPGEVVIQIAEKAVAEPPTPQPEPQKTPWEKWQEVLF